MARDEKPVNIHDLARQEIGRRLNGCGACTYDESDGSLVDHCAQCRYGIVVAVYALWPQIESALASLSPAPPRPEKGEPHAQS